MNIKSKYSIYILLGALTFLLTKFFAGNPEICELWYQKYFYAKIRILSDFLLAWSPFPWIYVFLVMMIIWIIRKLKATRYFAFSGFGILYRLIAFSALAYFLFQIFWGFNYQQRDLKVRLNLSVENIGDNIYLERLEALICAMTDTRMDIGVEMNKAVHSMPAKSYLEQHIRRDMKSFLQRNQLFNEGNVRVRMLDPPGSLLSLSTAGIYIPFVFEGHIDSGLHPLQIPFTLAHEMAHGYAVTDEGEANFVAFVVCANSTDAFIRYSGLFSYFRYLASNIQRNDPEIYALIRHGFPDFVQLDLDAVRLKMNQFPDLFPKIRNWIYDRYLNAQGVHAGIKSYSSVVQMVTGWELKRDYLF